VPMALKPGGKCLSDALSPSSGDLNRLVHYCLKRELDNCSKPGTPKAECS
jgi:hypothetical protein